MDDRNGWISNSLEYKTALKVYLMTDPQSELAQQILSVLMEKKRPLQEAYAVIYEKAGGDIGKIPPMLQEFYEVKK